MADRARSRCEAATLAGVPVLVERVLPMQYRRLGRAGVRVSALSLGSWVTYANQIDGKAAAEMLAAATRSTAST